MLDSRVDHERSTDAASAQALGPTRVGAASRAHNPSRPPLAQLDPGVRSRLRSGAMGSGTSLLALSLGQTFETACVIYESARWISPGSFLQTPNLAATYRDVATTSRRSRNETRGRSSGGAAIFSTCTARERQAAARS